MKLNTLLKVNPEFRNEVDSFFYNEIFDFNMEKIKKMYKSSPQNYKYFIDKLKSTLNIFSLNGNKLWENRFNQILSFNDKKLLKFLNNHLESRFILKCQSNFDFDNDVELYQMLAFCQAKKNVYSKSYSSLEYLFKKRMPEILSFRKIAVLLDKFLPYIFFSREIYIKACFHSNTFNFKNNFNLMKYLDKEEKFFNKEFLIDYCSSIGLTVRGNDKLIHLIINEFKGTDTFKKLFNHKTYSLNTFLTTLFRFSALHTIEDNKFLNLKNLIEIDNSIADDLIPLYLDKLFAVYTENNGFYSLKILNFVKTIPEINTKQLILYLSKMRKSREIKALIKHYPNLDKLISFA